MSSHEKKIRIMRDDKISTALLKLSLPTITGMMISALYNVVDAYFVSGMGASQMGAVSVAFPIVQIVIGIGLTFGNGAAVCISRQLGRGDFEQASRTGTTAVFGSLIAGLLVTAIAFLFMNRILVILGATDTILPYARTYVVIYLSGCAFQVFTIAMNNMVISEGASKMTMTALLLGGGLNVMLDPLFIYTFGWGVGGAALATIVAQAVTAMIYLWYILAKRGTIRIALKYFTPKLSLFIEIFKFGVPLLAFQVFSGLAIGMTNTAASQYGDSAVAAMGIVTRILAVAAYVVFGYVKGFQSIAGYNYGARNFVRLRESIKVSLLWVGMFCMVVTLILLFFPTTIMEKFSADDLDLINLGAKTLQANAIPFILFGVVMVYSTLFLVLGNAGVGGMLYIARQGIFFIPAILVLPRISGLSGVIWSQPMADLLSFVLTMFFVVTLREKLRDPDLPDAQEVPIPVIAVKEEI